MAKDGFSTWSKLHNSTRVMIIAGPAMIIAGGIKAACDISSARTALTDCSCSGDAAEVIDNVGGENPLLDSIGNAAEEIANNF